MGTYLYNYVQLCTLMYMRSNDLRANLKDALDAVIRGERVTFSRAGVTFEIVLFASGQTGNSDGLQKQPQGLRAQSGPNEGSASPRPVIRFCKNNHSIPAGRDRCLGKRCKFS